MQPHIVVTLVAAFAAAVLSGLGVGSAGLFVLYLTLVAGYAQPEAQALNLLFFLFSAGSSLLLHIRERKIPRRLVLFLAAAAIPGALLGSYLARTPALRRDAGADRSARPPGSPQKACAATVPPLKFSLTILPGRAIIEKRHFTGGTS